MKKCILQKTFWFLLTYPKEWVSWAKLWGKMIHNFKLRFKQYYSWHATQISSTMVYLQYLKRSSNCFKEQDIFFSWRLSIGFLLMFSMSLLDNIFFGSVSEYSSFFAFSSVSGFSNWCFWNRQYCRRRNVVDITYSVWATGWLWHAGRITKVLWLITAGSCWSFNI